MKHATANPRLIVYIIATFLLSAGAGAEEKPVSVDDWRVVPLADDFVEVYRSPHPDELFCFTPGLVRCPNGRLVATIDIGPSWSKKIPKPVKGKGRGMIFTSDDRGKTWTYRTNFPFFWARPFVSGDELYIIGQRGDVMISRSRDWGETWSESVKLTRRQHWHQSACNVHYANGNVYLVMERFKDNRQIVTKRVAGYRIPSWGVSELAPVLMRAKVGDDLLKRENWTFASELFFCEAVPDRELDWFGVPFYPFYYPYYGLVCLKGFRGCVPCGWLETNVVQFTDPDHYWYDPRGKTFHLWMRAHTGGTNYAAICKVVEKDDGSMETMLERVPSGKRILFVPCPGGQMRFHILYDDKTKLYWLLSSQSTDSMTRAERLPKERYSTPNNERHRLQLHFSRNCIDWCFAGLVAVGASPKQSRHYASMVIDGEDLHVLSRSGDEHAQSAHNVNITTFHTIRNFRRLVY